MPENILDLDVEPVQGLVCGNYLGWCVTSNRHAPKYEMGDILLTDREGRVAGHVPIREQESGAQTFRTPEGVRTRQALSISRAPK